MTLFERELGRPLTDDERPEAKLLCIALEGHPLRLIQAAAIFARRAAQCRRDDVAGHEHVGPGAGRTSDYVAVGTGT